MSACVIKVMLCSNGGNEFVSKYILDCMVAKGARLMFRVDLDKKSHLCWMLWVNTV